MNEGQALTYSNFDHFRQLSLRDYLQIARRRAKWIILTTIVISVSTLVVALRLLNIYRSETVIMVDPQQVPANYVASTVTTSIADRLSTIQQQVMSPTRLKRIIDTMGLYADLRGRIPDQDLINLMQKSTTIEVIAPGDRRLSTFRIAFVDKNPVQATQVANQLASTFIDENLKAREQQFYGTAEFLDNELQTTKKQLEAKEEELRRIKSQYLMDLPESRQYHLEALTGLQTQIATSRDRITQAMQQKIYLQSVLASTAPTVDLDTAGNPGASPYQSQIQRLETQLSGLERRYGPRYPDVRKIRAQIAELKAKEASGEKQQPVTEQQDGAARRGIRNPVLEAELQRLDQEIENQKKLQAQFQPQIDFHLSKLQHGPIFEQQIAGLMRDYENLRQHYSELLNRKFSADMASALESRQKGERFVVLDPAQIPQKPYRPNRPLIALAGLFGGLLGGIGLAVIAEMADESVRTEREASQIVGKPVLAGIPEILSKKDRFRKKMHAIGTLAGTIAASVALGFVLSYLSNRFF